MSTLRPLHWYLAGNSSWFLAFGAQGVLFAWLVTMVLRETPAMVGVAQMTLLLPGLLLLLVGGGIADRYGGVRVASFAQGLAAIPPLVLALIIGLGQLSYSVMLVYAACIGILQAFVTPARDGLLNDVAGASIQRTVMLASFTQFGFQIVGVLVAGLAEAVTAVSVLCFQSAILLAGAFALRRIEVPKITRVTPHLDIGAAIVEGARSVLRSPPIRMVCFQNVAMGLFFMGSFIVTSPLLVREVFDGSAADLSFVNAANALGLSSTIAVLLRLGDLKRPGRVLLLSQGIGALILLVGGLVSSFWAFMVVMFFWGVAGGFAMTMARTIVQELAPPDQRGRIMSFYGFTFMGAGPLGALLNGFLVSEFGAQLALIMVSGTMAVFMAVVGWFGPLWQLRPHQP